LAAEETTDCPHHKVYARLSSYSKAYVAVLVTSWCIASAFNKLIDRLTETYLSRVVFETFNPSSRVLATFHITSQFCQLI